MVVCCRKRLEWTLRQWYAMRPTSFPKNYTPYIPGNGYFVCGESNTGQTALVICDDCAVLSGLKW